MKFSQYLKDTVMATVSFISNSMSDLVFFDEQTY